MEFRSAKRFKETIGEHPVNTKPNVEIIGLVHGLASTRLNFRRTLASEK